MRKPKLNHLFKVIDTINEREEGIFALEVEYVSEHNCYVVIDFNEELYYGGYRFERTLDELNDAVRRVFGEHAYLECECPGRWLINNF